MNYKRYVEGYLHKYCELEGEDLAQATEMVWSSIKHALLAMTQAGDGSSFFDWEQVRDSAIRNTRQGVKIKMTPVRLFGLHILHAMLGISDFMEVKVSGIEPEKPPVSEESKLVDGRGRKATRNDLWNSFWTGPKTEDGTPLFHYDCALFVNAPAEMPPFEPDYNEVVSCLG